MDTADSNSVQNLADRPSRKLRSIWRFAITLAISCLAAQLVWQVPVAPMWESKALDSFDAYDPLSDWVGVIGWDFNGDLVTFEVDILRVREISTGKILREIPLPTPTDKAEAWHEGDMTLDGKWIILPTRVESAAGRNKTEVHVISVHDGRPRLPTVRMISYVSPSKSVDGRYLTALVDDEKQGAGDRIIDLESGEILPPTVEFPSFSPDSQQVVSYTDATRDTLMFYSLKDRHELGRCPAPTFPDSYGELLYARIRQWRGDRLEIECEFQRDNVHIYRTWTFRVEGTHLTDMRYMSVRDGSFTDASTMDEWYSRQDGCGIRIQKCPSPFLPVAEFWNGVEKWIPGDQYWEPVEQTTWQLFSQETGKPLSPKNPVRIDPHPYSISSDGKWLTSGGKQIRVWRLPPPARWPWALFAAAMPWVLLARWSNIASGQGRG